MHSTIFPPANRVSDRTLDKDKRFCNVSDEAEVDFVQNKLAFFQFMYKADTNQLSFLQLLSSSAYQKLTYHCKNSVAVFDAASRNFRKSIRIMTSSDLELNARGNKKVRYTVLEDGCKVSHFTRVINLFLEITIKSILK